MEGAEVAGEGEGEVEPLQEQFPPPNDVLVSFYLKRKIMDLELPPSNPVPTIDVYACRPQRLPFNLCKNGLEKGWCFFTNKKKGKILIPGDAGCYKVAGHEVIYRTDYSDGGRRTHQLVGFARTLDFYYANGHISNWSIQEFRINPSIFQLQEHDHATRQKVLNLVICKVVKELHPPKKDLLLLVFPDYKFEPTDLQLVAYHLKSRIMGQELPDDHIPIFDVLGSNPEELPLNTSYGKQGEWHFYAIARSGDILIADGGHYEASEQDSLYDESNYQLVGFVRTLDFYHGDNTLNAVPTKSEWSIKEFTINPDLVQVQEDDYDTMWRVNDLVVCKVINKNQQMPENREEDVRPPPEEDEEGIAEPEQYEEGIADPEEMEEDIADKPQEDEDQDSAESEGDDAPPPKRLRGE